MRLYLARLCCAVLTLVCIACVASSSCPQELEGSRVTDLAVGFNNSQCVYAGTLPIEKSRGPDAALFYTFWAAQSGRMDAPLLLWLQGGPGASSSLALFYELGPYILNDDLSISPRPVNWNHDFHLLFVDQPIGTGLSRRPNGTSLVHNETEVGNDADEFLRNFFQKYTAYTKGNFYVVGESYGGHYVPSVALRVYEGNQDPNQAIKIPIRGLAVGNGFNSPCDQIPLSPGMAYEMGLISSKEKAEIDVLADTLRAACAAGDHVAAYANVGLVLEGILAASGQVNRKFQNYNHSSMLAFFNNVSRQEALHVPNPPVDFLEKNYDVFFAMTPDQMVSMKPRYAALLDEAGLDVLIYHGNLDPCFTTAGEEAWLRSLKWSGSADFHDAKRNFWKVDTGGGAPEMAGYLTHAKNLTYALVLQSGHLAPGDQPVHMYDLITRFVNKQWL